MRSEILPLPQPWLSGLQQPVTVNVDNAPPGINVTVDLFRTLPKPEQHLGTIVAAVSSLGQASAAFNITLPSKGVNVLHCEVTHPADSDSDSAATVVI